MALADPQSLDIGGAVSLPRTGSGMGTGEFTSADGTVTLTFTHVQGKTIRSLMRASKKKIAASELVPSVNVPIKWSAQLTLVAPPVGVSAQEKVDIIKSICISLSANSYALVTKFVGLES